MKNSKLVKISLIFAFVLYIMLAGTNTTYAGTLSSDINGINESKYPGVKSLIQNLQNKHSNYKFQVYYTGIDWTEAVTMEYQGHGSSPKNLFSLSGNYKGKWYCPICGSRKYDTGWYCASVEAIEYMMDPRNSLDETSVYQFKNLETSDVSSNDIQAIINNKYASYSYLNNPTAINAIVQASKACNLNGFSILAKIVNEQGRGNSPLVTGIGYDYQYIGYYNFFNVGAYGNGTNNVMLNGLKYAYNKGWNSVEKSIVGGSDYYKSGYIAKGQNTLYYQRFNVVYERSLFSHQYQQDIMGAQTSATLLKNYYATAGTISTVNHTFIIPLYENMPQTVCGRPSTAENSKLEYTDETVLNNKVAVKASPNSGRIISYLNKNEKIKVLKRAEKKSSDGKYWDTIVTNTDGTYGYIERSNISGQVEKFSLPNYVFDSKYYADHNTDIKAVYGYDEEKLLKHFVDCGVKEGRASSPTFDVKYYVQNNADVKAAVKSDYMGAYNHFVNCGKNEYRKSSPEYEGMFYRYYYKDTNNLSSTKLMEHYINTGRPAGRLGGIDASIESIVFDPCIYATCNEDIRKTIGYHELNLRKHWLQNGITEGRISSLTFDPQVYMRVNEDVQKAFGSNYKSIFEHFVKAGINEGRMSSLMFEVQAYLNANADIKGAFRNNYKQAYLHFKDCGMYEGRTASSVFDVRTYLNSNTDIKAVCGNDYRAGIIHFVNYGMHEKRKASATFSVVYYAQNQDVAKAYGTKYKEYYIHYLVHGRAEGRRGI